MKKFIVMVGMIMLGIGIIALLSGNIQPSIGGVINRSVTDTRTFNP